MWNSSGRVCLLARPGGPRAAGGLTRLQAGVHERPVPLLAAISACGKGMQWKQALELMSQMRYDRVAPNTITFCATIRACENGMPWKQAFKPVS